MTGYLLRKAASVLTPGSSIHPVVRPMFSGFGPQLTPEPAIPEEATETTGRPAPVAPGPQPMLPAADARRAEPPRSQPPIGQPRPDTSAPATPPPAAAPATATLTPPVDRSAPEPLLSAHRHEPAPQGLSPVIPLIIASTGASRPAGKAEPAPPPPPPLPPLAVDPSPAGRPDSRRPTEPSGSAAQRPGVPSPGRATVARAPDEVQIHIGRIEITAAPPEPARAPARPPRTVLPLADYLKRRDGRA